MNKHLVRLRRNSPTLLVDCVDAVSGGNVRLHAWKNWTAYKTCKECSSPFFIVGCGRSGNTLLRTLLSNNYYVCIPPEIPGLGNTIRAFTRSRARPWQEIVEIVLTEFKKNANTDNVFKGDLVFNLDKELALDYEKLKQDLFLLDKEKQALSTILLSIYNNYAENQLCHDCAIGDKTPWNAFHLDRIYKVFPEARYVYLLRDPRATSASYVYNFNGITQFTVKDAAKRWVDSNKRIISFFKKHPEVRYHEISYEELIHDTDKVVEGVAAFLELTKRPKKDQSNQVTFLDEKLPHYQKAFQPVDKDSLEKWKLLLKENEIKQVESICSKLIRAKGYSVDEK